MSDGDTPIEKMIDAVLQPVGKPDIVDDMPYVTHQGVLELCGKTLRCYRLSSGDAVFDADDFNDFWNDFAAFDKLEGRV